MSGQSGDKCSHCGNWNSKHVARCTFCNAELPPLQPNISAIIQSREKQSDKSKLKKALDSIKETKMPEQPLKSRTIKTAVQKEATVPAVDNAMLINQYTAIITYLKNIQEQLDFLIAQPQAKPKPVDPVQKMEKSLGIWEQTPAEKKEQGKKEIAKKKSSKGMIIFLITLGIIILAGIYFAWGYTQGYTFFWNA